MIDVATWRKAWALLDTRERRNALMVLGIVILAAFASAMMVGSVMPFLSVLAEPKRVEQVRQLAWIYENFGFTSTYDFLVGLGVGSLVVIIIANLIQMAKTYIVARFTTMRVHTISYRLLQAYLLQPFEFFLDRHSGDMGPRILAESQQVVNQFFRPAVDVIASSLTVLAIIALLVWVNPFVTAICFVTLGAVYTGTYAFSRRYLQQNGQARVKANGARYRIANEALGGVKDIKLLGREISYIRRYQVPSRAMARAEVVASVISTLPQFAVQAVAFGGIIFLCLMLMDPTQFRSGQALGGVLPVLGVFAFAGQRLMPELSKIYTALTRLQYGTAAVNIVHADLVDKAGSGQLPRTSAQRLELGHEVRLDHATYRYPNAENASLLEVSLAIAAGERIGVVGSTGAGKTTLADIILGLLRLKTGSLSVDGVVITEDNLRAWQRSVGYVPQDIFLTDASISENIALGVPPNEISESRVRESAQIAQIDTFIRSELPEGYDSTVGERGVRLSGGQRQRIGIARALYHDADLIIFDEATNALDNLTEHEVMAAIQALPGDKTIIMIAHRLSTVRICDRILVLDNGRLVGIGNWDQLISGNEHFRKLAQLTQVACPIAQD